MCRLLQETYEPHLLTSESRLRQQNGNTLVIEVRMTPAVSAHLGCRKKDHVPATTAMQDGTHAGG